MTNGRPARRADGRTDGQTDGRSVRLEGYNLQDMAKPRIPAKTHVDFKYQTRWGLELGCESERDETGLTKQRLRGLLYDIGSHVVVQL